MEPESPETEISSSTPEVIQHVYNWTNHMSLDASAVFGVPKETEQALVFLCHSSSDKEQVRALYLCLVGDGVRCWFDEEDLQPGQDWDYEISRAIRRSRFVLVCLSRTSSTKSGYVQKEIRKALDVADEQPEGVAYIIPVRLEECEIPERLKRWHWVDLFKDGAYERLLRSLGVVAPAKPEPTRAISSNDFNVKVSASIRRIWFDSFVRESHWEQKLTRRDGGVDVSIRPQSNPHAELVSFKTFPSPDATITAELMEEALAGVTSPCLVVTRTVLSDPVRAAMKKANIWPLEFIQWASDVIDEIELEQKLGSLRQSYEDMWTPLFVDLPDLPTPVVPDVSRYVRDVHNRISQLAGSAIGDQLATIRTEDKVDGTDFVTILAPTQRLNAEFALKVAWEQDKDRLADQVRTAKQWMREHGMWGVIATREYLTERAIQDLNFNSNERHIQLLLWRGPEDDESLKQCLRRITGSGH